jgi:pimeloyl-ACP methyl ester carboxylesterase
MALIRTPGHPSISIDDGGPDSGACGIPVLFLHSLAGNANHWLGQLEHLRRERRAIALDLRGHGRSEPSLDGDYAIESLAGDIDAVVSLLGLLRFVLVGHSLGGSVSIAYAGAHQEKVVGLLLADPSGDARKVPKEMMIPFMAALESASYAKTIEEYWQGMLTGSRPEIQERILRDLHDMRQETVVGTFRSSLQFDPIAMLRRFKGPKLSVITELNDTPLSLHNLLPDLPFLRITGTGHWLQLDRPDEFNRIMDEFLLSIEASISNSPAGASI